MEFLAEILFEVYGELMFLIIPEKKMNKKYLMISKIIAILVYVGAIALAVWGVVLIADCGNLMGIVPISVAAILSLAQIVAGIVLYKKRR